MCEEIWSSSHSFRSILYDYKKLLYLDRDPIDESDPDTAAYWLAGVWNFGDWHVISIFRGQPRFIFRPVICRNSHGSAYGIHHAHIHRTHIRNFHIAGID